jgi:hypothetical protein
MDTWNLMRHWNLVLPPSRPTNLQLTLVRSLAKDLDVSRPVAVLGSTPEYRDLLYEMGFQRIYVLERNMTFYDAVAALRVYRNDEYVIQGDWLTSLPGLEERFSLILSDLTSGNISYENRRIFYDCITAALEHKGIFFDKVLTHPGPNLEVEALEEKYSSLPLNLLNVNYFSCEMLFCSKLLDINQTVDTALFYSILAKRMTNERVRVFAEHAKQVTPDNCLWHYGRTWDQLEPEYCKSLSLTSIVDDDETSPYYRRLKFFTHIKE